MYKSGICKRSHAFDYLHHRSSFVRRVGSRCILLLGVCTTAAEQHNVSPLESTYQCSLKWKIRVVRGRWDGEEIRRTGGNRIVTKSHLPSVHSFCGEPVVPGGHWHACPSFSELQLAPLPHPLVRQSAGNFFISPEIRFFFSTVRLSLSLSLSVSYLGSLIFS